MYTRIVAVWTVLFFFFGCSNILNDKKTNMFVVLQKSRDVQYSYLVLFHFVQYLVGNTGLFCIFSLYFFGCCFAALGF